jgi:NitT/TauT family transport system substrate-binding protein
MITRIRRALAARMAAALLLVGAADAAMGQDQGVDAEAPLRIHGNLTTLEIAPVLLAADQIYDGEVAIHMGGVPNLHGEAGPAGFSEPGLADLATNAETQGLRYSVEHPDLRMIMTVTEGLYRIVARRSAGIETLADLKGKRIATIPNTSSGYFLHRMLATAGLSEADVTITPIMPLSGMPAALAAGEVDAVTIWEPEIENAAAAIGEDAVIFQDPSVYRELFNLNTTAGALEDPARRAAIVAFVRAVIEASERIESDPSLAWPYVTEAAGFPPELLARAWEHHAFPKALAPDLLDVMVAEELWLAGGAGRPARSREELATLIDGSVLEEALAGMEAGR